MTKKNKKINRTIQKMTKGKLYNSIANTTRDINRDINRVRNTNIAKKYDKEKHTFIQEAQRTHET